MARWEIVSCAKDSFQLRDLGISLFHISKGLDQRWQPSVKGQIVRILGFAGHMVPVTTPQLCSYGAEAGIDNT